MKLSTREAEGVTVIALEGSVLGGPDATVLNDTLHKLAEKNKKRVLLDLSGVQTMNSSGLSMLIAALRMSHYAFGAIATYY